MNRRAAVEQQHRTNVGGDGVGKKRRVGVRLKRSQSVSGIKLVGGEEKQQPQQSGAIESLAYEIDSVVKEQEHVLGLLRRKSGLFRGLGNRFKTAIRGMDGEHDLKGLNQRLNWLRQKEAQLREEKLLLLIKDVSELPNLQVPGAVDAAVASASAAERGAAKSTAPPSKTRFGFRRSASSIELSRSGTKANGGGAASSDNDKENREGAAESNVRQALSMQHSFGRSGARDEVSPGRRPAIGNDSRLSRGRHDAFRVDGGGGDGGGGSSGIDGGIAAPGNADRVHISSFARVNFIFGGGESYLAPNEGHQPQRQFQSSGGFPISGSIWRRPVNAHPLTSADFEVDAGGTACTAEAVAAAAAAAAEAAAVAEAEKETPYLRPYLSSRGWKHAEMPQLDASQDTAGEVPSEMSSPPRLMHTRVSTDWEQELGAKAGVMRRQTVMVDGKQLPTVSGSQWNSGNGAFVNSSTSTRSQPVTAAVAGTPSNTDTDTGSSLESSDGVQDAREVRFATKPEVVLVSPGMRGTTATATAARETTSPAAPSKGEREKLAAKTALLRVTSSSSSFEPPCEIDRLIPAAAERRRLSPTPSAAEQPLEFSETTTTPTTSEAETSDGMVERESAPSVVGTVGGEGAGVGVETFSTWPGGLGPNPSEMVAADGVDAMVDAAGGEEATGGNTGVEPAKMVGTRANEAPPPSYAELHPSETASSASVTTLAVDTTTEIASSLAITPTASQSIAPDPAPAARPSKPDLAHPAKHPLASMGDLLTSCFAFVDATNGNSSLPESLRTEMKQNAIAAARSAEVSKAVKMETPPSVWVTRYEDMSKKYGLGFLLSDGSSGITFKDGTRMALDAGCAVFEYVDGGKHDSSSSKKSGSETIDPSPSSEAAIGGEPSTPGAPMSAVEMGMDPSSGPGVAGEQSLMRQRSRHHRGTASRSGGGDELQKPQAQTQQQQQRRRRTERIGYPLNDYPSSYGKKVTIAQKVRELLQRTAGEEDSAAGSTKSAAKGGGWGEVEVGADDAAAAAAAGSGGRSGSGETVLNPVKAPRTGAEPLVFVDDWKRTRSSWIFRLSNGTLQVVFLDATEILLTEEARLITYVDKRGVRETLALLRALDEDRLDVIVRVRECHALIKKVIRPHKVFMPRTRTLEVPKTWTAGLFTMAATNQAAAANEAISSNPNVVKANAALSPGMESSLFGCFSDPVGCLIACCCGCVVSGFSAASLDNRPCTICDAGANDYQTRQALRARFNMGYAPLPECLAMMCCQCCFIIQTAKEVALKKGTEPVYFGEVSMNLMGDR
eukprot:g11835.t1